MVWRFPVHPSSTRGRCLLFGLLLSPGFINRLSSVDKSLIDPRLGTSYVHTGRRPTRRHSVCRYTTGTTEIRTLVWYGVGVRDSTFLVPRYGRPSVRVSVDLSATKEWADYPYQLRDNLVSRFPGGRSRSIRLPSRVVPFVGLRPSTVQLGSGGN